MSCAFRSAAIAAAMIAVACAPERESVSHFEDRGAVPASPETVATFTGTVDVDAGTVTFAIAPPAGTASSALTTLPVVQDGTPWAGPPQTVELLTTAVRWPVENGCGPGVYALEADVAVSSFFASARLRNVHVELTSMTPSGRESCNSSPAFEDHSDANGGLWSYGDLEPVGMEPPPSTATVTWRLKLPTAANFTFTGRVVADPVLAAAIDPVSLVPSCGELGAACDTGDLVEGRSWWWEAQPPSNLWNCWEGAWDGSYHVEESLDRLTISTVDGTVLAPEKLVRIDATVWAADPADALDLWVNADPLGPGNFWSPVATLTPAGLGLETLSAELMLQFGGTRQAIRGVFRRGGEPAPVCGQSQFDDTDDLLFAVDNSAVYETIPPAVSLSLPMGSWLTGTVPIQIDGSDNSGIVTGQLLLDGVPVGAAIALPGQVDFDTTAFGNGTYYLSAIARDPSGNETESAWVQVNIDNGAAGDRTPPVVEVPPPGGAVRGTVQVGVNIWEQFLPVTWQLYVDGVALGSPASYPDVYMVDWDTTLYADGTHTLTATAWDQAGNEGTSVPVDVVVDNTPPTIVITAPADGTEVGTSFVATATVDEFVYWVDFYVDGVYVYEDWGSPPWTATLSTVGLAPGPHVLTAQTMDAGGNVAESAPVGFIAPADTVAPAVSMTQSTCALPGCPVDGTAVMPSAAYYVSISATDLYGVARVELWVDGAVYVGRDTPTQYTSLTWTASAVPGPHTLQARAYDAAGNVGYTALATVTVDGTPPTGAFVAPAPGATVSDEVLFQVSAADDLAVARVVFYVDGVEVGRDETAPWEVTWDSGTVDNRAVSLSARVVDSALNYIVVSGPTVTVANPWTAVWDSASNGWLCTGRSAKCGTGTALDGRYYFLGESQPSTLGDSCPDGTVAEYTDSPLPYVESIRLATVSGEPLDAGQAVRATVVASGDWARADAVDLYYATDATAPAWTRIGTVPFTSGTPTPANFTFDWTLSSENPNGVHALRATARRGGTAAACTTGDHDDHDDVAFEVGDHVPPTVEITSPAAGAVVVGMVTITADASDVMGIDRVEFWRAGTLLATDTTPPYEAIWNTYRERNELQGVQVIAFDTQGLSSSDWHTVTVANPTTELLSNGGFESGHVAWVESPAAGVIDNEATYPAWTGTWKAQLGGKGFANTSSICQTATIPSSANQVEWSMWDRVYSSETASYQDWMNVVLRRTDGFLLRTFWTIYNDNPPSYYKATLVLNEYRGQTVKLCFEATENSSLATTFLLDDVSLIVK